MDVLIIGFGSQAKAWALNLRDSGHQVTIALRENSTSFETVKKLKFKTEIIENLNDESRPTLLLIPDEQHFPFLKENSKSFQAGCSLITAHGFSLCYQDLFTHFPSLNFLMLAPKAIASEVRFQFETGGDLAAIASLHQTQNEQSSKDLIENLAKGIGITKGPYFRSVREETNADLFSEQALLCSVLPYFSEYAFNLLIEKGISKEVAYFECWHEVGLIAQTMTKLGPEKFFNLVSPNALIGGERGRRQLLTEATKKSMDELYQQIESGQFLRELESTDFQQVRAEVLDYWRTSKLAQTHLEI